MTEPTVTSTFKCVQMLGSKQRNRSYGTAPDMTCIKAPTGSATLDALCEKLEAASGPIEVEGMDELLACFEALKMTADEQLECLEALKESPQKPQYVPTHYQEADTCIPLIAEIKCNPDGSIITPFPLGYINEAGVFTVASNIEVGASGNTTKQDKADPTPLFITGPATATDIATLIADQIAASAVTTFPIAGLDILPEHILNCGSVSFVDLNGTNSIVLNGQTDTPIANWTDSDGVNGLNTIEVLDGCTVAMTSCAFKDYELDKAGNVVSEKEG